MLDSLNLILIVLGCLIVFLFQDRIIQFLVYIVSLVTTKEGFQDKSDGWVLQEPTQVHYENAHGSAPAGVNAEPGTILYTQNANADHVNPANKRGNPQNINPEFKMQP